MIRILIIVLAVAAGIGFGMMLGRLQTKRKQHTSQTTYVDEGKRTPILPWLIGLVVLFFGLLWLANSEPGDTTSQYNPARLENGTLVPPHFSNRTENDAEPNADTTSAPIVLPPSTPLSLPTPPPLPLPSRNP